MRDKVKVALLYSNYYRPVEMYYLRWPEQFRNDKINTKYFSIINPESKKGFDENALYVEGKLNKIHRSIKYFSNHPELAKRWFTNQEAASLRRKIKLWAEFSPLITYEPDVIHCVNSRMATKLFNLHFPKRPKIIVSFRGYDTLVQPYKDPRWNEHLEHIYEIADRFHYVSHYLKNYAIDKLGAPSEKCCVIYAGVDTKLFKPIDNKQKIGQNRGTRLLTIGGLRWQKGYEFMLLSIKKLVDEGLDIIYTIIGGGQDEIKLKMIVDRLNIGKYVQFLGVLPKEEVAEYLAQADIYIQPSVTDALPGTIREACAVGLPVIATNVDGIPEIIEDGKNGLLVTSCSPEALAEAVIRLINNLAEAEALGMTARKTIEQKFSMDLETKLWQNLYCSI